MVQVARGRGPGGRPESAPASAKVASLATTSSGVPHSPFSRSSSTWRPMAAARRATSASSVPQQTTWAAEQHQGGRVAAGRLAGGPDPLELGTGVGQRAEGHVELGREAGRQPRGALGPAAADDDRRAGPLHRLGQRRAVRELVVTALEGEPLPDRGAPQPGDDGQLLLQPIEALADRREGDAVGGVLVARTSRRRGRARPGRRSWRRPRPPRRPAARAAGRWRR